MISICSESHINVYWQKYFTIPFILVFYNVLTNYTDIFQFVPWWIDGSRLH